MAHLGLDLRSGVVPDALHTPLSCGLHVQGQQLGPAGIPQKSSNPADPAFCHIRKQTYCAGLSIVSLVKQTPLKFLNQNVSVYPEEHSPGPVEAEGTTLTSARCSHTVALPTYCLKRITL